MHQTQKNHTTKINAEIGECKFSEQKTKHTHTDEVFLWQMTCVVATKWNRSTTLHWHLKLFVRYWIIHCINRRGKCFTFATNAASVFHVWCIYFQYNVHVVNLLSKVAHASLNNNIVGYADYIFSSLVWDVH